MILKPPATDLARATTTFIFEKQTVSDIKFEPYTVTITFLFQYECCSGFERLGLEEKTSPKIMSTNNILFVFFF